MSDLTPCYIFTGVRFGKNWNIAVIDGLSKFQNHLRGLLRDDLLFSLYLLSYKRNVASLLLIFCYFYGKFSERPHSLVILIQPFTARTRLATSTEPYLLHLHWVPNIRK